MDKVISIIIPTYNMEALLPRCLDSLLIERGLERIEVWVINDGSCDTSSQIAHGYADRYPGVFKVLDKSNGNYGSCINAALKVITGRYVKILDADDYFNTANFEKMVDLLEHLDIDLLFTDSVEMHKNGKTRRMCRCSKVHPDEVVDFLGVCSKKSVWNAPMHNFTYRSSIFSEIDYHQTEGVSYTDLEWTLQPTERVRRFYYLPLTVYCYQLDREGQSCSPEVLFKSMHAHKVVALANIEHFLKCDRSHPTMRKALTSKLLRLPYKMLRNQRKFNNVDNDDMLEVLRTLREKCPRELEQLNKICYVMRKTPIFYVKSYTRLGHIPWYAKLLWRLYYRKSHRS